MEPLEHHVNYIVYVFPLCPRPLHCNQKDLFCPSCTFQASDPVYRPTQPATLLKDRDVANVIFGDRVEEVGTLISRQLWIHTPTKHRAAARRVLLWGAGAWLAAVDLSSPFCVKPEREAATQSTRVDYCDCEVQAHHAFSFAHGPRPQLATLRHTNVVVDVAATR